MDMSNIRRRLVAIGAVALGAAVVTGGISYAASTAPTVIRACVKTSDGDMAITTTGKCKSGWKLLEWNQRGDKGEPGKAGPAGPKGPTGPAGPSGGSSSLAGKRCPVGGVMIGVKSNGSLDCAVPDATLCDDGNPRTGPDVYHGTSWEVQDPFSHNQPVFKNYVTNDNCGGGTTVSCDDGNPNTNDTLDPATGQCRHDPYPAGTPCDDGDPNTVNDVADGLGGCHGTRANTDTDGDGVPNASDNCPDVSNPDQSDQDFDGRGDRCDPCPTLANPGSAPCPLAVSATDFGAVGVSTVATRTLTFTNENPFPVTIDDILAPSDPQFAVADPSACVGHTLVANTGICAVTVGFAPNVVGAASGGFELRFRPATATSGGSMTFTLTGVGF